MKKRTKENPKLLKHVVKAVTDLKEIKGSTVRKILDQVRTTLHNENPKSRPNTIVMLVKTALKHAVQTGTLTHQAGKYRLAMKKAPRTGNKARRTATLRKRPTRKVKVRRSRRMQRPKYTPSVSSATPSRSGSGSTADTSYTTETDKRLRSIRRRRRSVARRRSVPKKTVKLSRSVMKAKSRKRKAIQRQATPLPTPVKVEDQEEAPAIIDEIDSMDRIEQAFAEKTKDDQQEEEYRDASYEEAPNDYLPPECDNPECLCNLKQEPCEEMDYDDDDNNNPDQLL